MEATGVEPGENGIGNHAFLADYSGILLILTWGGYAAVMGTSGQEYAEVVWTDTVSIGNDFSRAPFYGWIIAMSSDNLCMREESGWVCFDQLSQELADKQAELKTFK